MKGGKLIHILIATALCMLNAAEGRKGFIDLSYSFNNQTVLFPGRTSTFNVELEGYTADGFWVASKGFCTSEHTSTHIDAPYHFNKNGRTLDQIPLEDLIEIPGVMIDVYDKVHAYDKEGKANIVQNYALSREDILQWEKTNGRIPDRAVVLVRSGWGARWPNKYAYQGIDAPTEESTTTATPAPAEDSSKPLSLEVHLNFPGFSASAASFLVTERNVLGVGIDTLSIDVGSTKVYPAHQVFAARNVYMIENVGNLHLLPARGFKLWMLPFKIDRGTGAPIRVIAKLNSEDKH